MTNRYKVCIACCSAVIFSIVIFFQLAAAEPVIQTFTLKPGWNAVFLEVDPAPHGCDQVFQYLPDVESVWKFEARNSPVQFIQDPDVLIPDDPQWLSCFPGNPVITNLHAIYGETAYLIKNNSSQDKEWSIPGEPRLPRIQWKPDAFNFVGFHLDPGNEPFFEEFFASSPAHAGQEIYILNNQGDWQKVENPAITRMQHGEGFWIYCKGHSNFQGPLSVQLDSSIGLHYGRHLVEQNLRVVNSGAADLSPTLTLTGSNAHLPLQYWYFNQDNEEAGWKDFPMVFTVSAADHQTLRMGVRRSGLAPSEEYTSNLVLNNNEGMRIIIPASVEGISHAGLWVGAAVIRKVSEPRANDPNLLYPTGSEFSFRLILHVNNTGQVRLLRQAIQLWDEVNNHFVLFTDDSLVGSYLGSSSNQSSTMRRISSAAFSRLSDTGPIWEAPMTGSFNEASGSLSCTVKVASDDPLNPFFHKYHPEHKDTDKAFEVARAISMKFSDTDGDGNPITSDTVLTWGGSDMGGIYRETLTGLHKDEIKVEGIFLLHKVSSVGQLTR